jgi:hypothetical protein
MHCVGGFGADVHTMLQGMYPGNLHAVIDLYQALRRG